MAFFLHIYYILWSTVSLKLIINPCEPYSWKFFRVNTFKGCSIQSRDLKIVGDFEARKFTLHTHPMNKLEFCQKIKMLWPQNSKMVPKGSLFFVKPFITVLDLVCSTIFFKRIIHPLKTFCGFSTHFFLNNCKCSFLHVEKIRGNDLLLLHIIFV